MTGEFPTQMASNAENVSIWWRHHVYIPGKIIGELERVRFCGNSDFLGSYTIRDTDVTILVLGDVVGQISVTAVAGTF